MKLQVKWEKTPNGNYQTRTVDPRNGKTYLSAPVPYAFAVKLGMKDDGTTEAGSAMAVASRRHALMRERTEAIARKDWAAMNEITKKLAKLPLNEAVK